MYFVPVYGVQEVEISHSDLDLRVEFGESFFLEELIFDSNSFHDAYEARTLCGLSENSAISVGVLQRGIDTLLKKNIYESLIIRLEDGKVGKKLTLRAKKLWIVRAISISGIMIGKDFYRHCYVMEPGDCFDEKKHHYALDRIRQEVRKDGYVQAQVTGDVTRDEATKAVDIHIAIVLGNQFDIGSITLDGDEHCRDSCQEIISKAQIFVRRALAKDRYSAIAINRMCAQLRKYLMKLGISSVRIQLKERIDEDKRSVHLYITLEDVEQRKFVFFGNKFFSDAQLQEVIASFGTTITVVPLSMVEQEITRVYRAKGFWNMHVEAQEHQKHECYCIINEGPRARIKDVELCGIDEKNGTILHATVLRKVKIFYFEEDEMANILASIERWYEAEGFLQMRCSEQEYVCQDDGTYVVRLCVHEGKRSFITGIVVENFPDLEHEGPIGAFAAKINKTGRVILDAQEVQEQKRWLLDYFNGKGYLQADALYELEESGDSLKVVWKITPGPLTFFGKTVVQGALSMPYCLLDRELQYREGNIWDSEKLHASLLRLKALNLFATVHMHPDHEETKDNNRQDRTVIIKLCPDNRFEVRLRAGLGLQQVGKNFVWGHGFTYKLGTTLLCKNPFNRADIFLLDADFARSHQDIQVEYRRPWLFSVPIRSSFKGYITKYDQPGFVGNCDPLYQIVRQGFIAGFNRCFGISEITVNAGLEWLKTMIEPDRQELAYRVGEAIDFSLNMLDEKVPYLLLEPTVVIDFFDNRLCPMKGSFTSIAIKSMIPISHKFSQAYFTRVQFEQAFVVPLVPRLIASARVRVGHIFNSDFSSVMPSERFYLGGANSVRSYDTDLCPPIGTYRDQKDVERIAPCGGKSMLNINVELRFLCYRMLEIAIFQDVGMLVEARGKGSRLYHVVEATGFGLRYNTPIGPVRFDIAWKWHTNRKYQHSFAWFLRLGHIF